MDIYDIVVEICIVVGLNRPKVNANGWQIATQSKLHRLYNVKNILL